ncbi:hypothetical protein Tco_0432565 [Tanacetum coccineum]
MDDTRTMAQLLEAPTAGYEDAIVVPEITADNFELKHGLLNLVQNKQFFGHDKEDPHAHIRYFNKITSTMKFPNVPSVSYVDGVVVPIKSTDKFSLPMYVVMSNDPQQDWIHVVRINVLSRTLKKFECSKIEKLALDFEKYLGKDYHSVITHLWTVDPPFSQNSMSSPGDGFKPSNDDKKKVDEDSRKENKNVSQQNIVSCSVGRKTNIELPHDPHMPELEDYSIFDSSNDDEDVGAEADMNNCFKDEFYGRPYILLGIVQSQGLQAHRNRNSKAFLLARMKQVKEVDVYMYRYLKGQQKLGLWYLKDSPFDLVAYTDSDYARASLGEEVTTGATAKAKTVNGEVQLQALVDGKKIIITESIVRRYLQLEDAEGADCLPNDTIFEQLTLIGAKTIAWNEFSSIMASAIICLATNQKFNFSKYIFECMVKNLDNVGKFLMYPRKQRPRNPKRKDTKIPQSSSPTDNVADEAANEEMDDSLERVATTATSLDADQDRVNTSRSGEDSMKLKELMEFCTKLQQRVLDLENTKTAQAQEITSLKLRVKKLEKKGGLGDQEDASKQGRKIDNIDKDAKITLVDETQWRYGDDIMFNVSDLVGEEVFVVEQGVPDSKKDDVVSAAGAVTIVSITSIIPVSAALTTDVEIPLAQALAELKSAIPTSAASTRPRAKGLVIHEEEQATTPTVSSQQPSQIKVQDKGKGIMVEEPLKMKKKDKISFDEQEAKRLQTEFDEEERIAREKDKANIALTEEWDDIQAKIDADYQLAQRLQAEEQEVLTDTEKARLFI